MSPNPYLELERACDRIAQRRPAWPRRLGIEGISTIADVVAMVRNENPTACMSDGVIRALVAVGERDALTVLLHGLSGPLLDRLSPVATEDYRADALGDLTLVVFDAIQRGDLIRCDRLAHRFANRAHTRTHKRTRLVYERGVRSPVAIEPLPPERITLRDDLTLGAADDVAETAAARVDLQRFAAAVEQAIADGEFQAEKWADVKAHRLSAVFTATEPRTNHQRADTSRHVRQLLPLAETYLAEPAA